MLDRTAVGRTTTPTLNEVERGAVRRFAEALTDASAPALGLHGAIAPAGFACALDPGGDLRAFLGVPVRQLMLAEVTLESERPLVTGDRLLVSARVAEVGERATSAGRVGVAVIEDEGRDEQGRLVYRLRRTWVRTGRDG